MHEELDELMTGMTACGASDEAESGAAAPQEESEEDDGADDDEEGEELADTAFANPGEPDIGAPASKPMARVAVRQFASIVPAAVPSMRSMLALAPVPLALAPAKGLPTPSST